MTTEGRVRSGHRIDTAALPHPHIYFAYGSNLDPDQMEWRCPESVELGRAVLHGWSWHIGGRGYASVSPDRDGSVWGGLWNVSDTDLAVLDRYEGVAGGLYRREIVTVSAEGQNIDALIYIENENDRGVPSGEYLGRILVGAEHFGLPRAWIDGLANWG